MQKSVSVAPSEREQADGWAPLQWHLTTEIITLRRGIRVSYVYGKLLKGRVWPPEKNNSYKRKNKAFRLTD